MSQELFQKIDDDDFTILNTQNDNLDPELARASLSDLSASTANMVRTLGEKASEGDFQTVFNLLTSGIRAFRTGVSHEHIIKALQEGWKRGKIPTASK